MKIDFIIPWVDGNDSAWMREKARYQIEKQNDSNSANRFRDLGFVALLVSFGRKIHSLGK